MILFLPSLDGSVEWMSPLFLLSSPFVATPHLAEDPPLELKVPLLVGFEAPSQERISLLFPHQTLHPFTQLSFWGKVSTPSSRVEFWCNPQKLITLLSAQVSSLNLWRYGSKQRLQNYEMRHIWIYPREILLHCNHTKNMMMNLVLQVDYCVSSHKCKGRPCSCSIALATPTMLQFFLSATPFCSGLWGAANSLQMPSFA